MRDAQPASAGDGDATLTNEELMAKVQHCPLVKYIATEKYCALLAASSQEAFLNLPSASHLARCLRVSTEQYYLSWRIHLRTACRACCCSFRPRRQRCTS